MHHKPIALFLAALLVGATTHLAPTPAHALTTTVLTSPPPPPVHFDGTLLGTTKINAIRSAAADARPLLTWSPCPAEHPTLLAPIHDHCASFSVGNDVDFTTYILPDTRCPAAAGPAACYGGYLIAARIDTHRTFSSSGGTLHEVAVSRMRLGVSGPVASSLPPAPPTLGYRLPLTPAFTLTRDAHYSDTTAIVVSTLQDAAGRVIGDDGFAMMADGGSTVSCDDLGALAAGVVALATAGVVVGVSVAIAAVGVYAGAWSAFIGFLVGGPGGFVAGAAIGISLADASFGLAALAGAGIAGVGLAGAALTGLGVREACEAYQELEAFDPAPFPGVQQHQAQSSGANESSVPMPEFSDDCEGSNTYVVEVGGMHCEQTCKEVMVDGECTEDCGENICTPM